MREIVFKPTFADWQTEARSLLRAGVHPQDVCWTVADKDQSSLGLFLPPDVLPQAANSDTTIRVPREFIDLAKSVARHSASHRWALLYRILWRITHYEPKALENPVDPDVIDLHHLSKEVQKDAYRMRAFLRFRETRLDGEPWFIAWYEPEYDVVELNQSFFTDRFANMRWSILTPFRCMHWDGRAISFSEGADNSMAPQGDDVEPLWITYYSHIFNPARIKPEAMQAQLLKRNWKNLPEAVVIEPLLRNARGRSNTMIAASEFKRVRDEDYSIANPPADADLNQLRIAAASCRACPLWKTATCTVFGEGPREARIVLVGEQPGDQEDRAGKPFIGPAGDVLNRALAAAGVNRTDLYVTNAVKHFKFEPRGKRRIHKTASPREIAACRPWLQAELAQIKPDLIVALGATAARSLFNETIRISDNRGQILQSEFGPTLITIHPSALLRLPDPANFENEFARYVGELTSVQRIK